MSIVVINPYSYRNRIPEAFSIKNSLVSWYTFDSNNNDSTSNANNMGTSGGSTYTAGKVGNGINVNGTSPFTSSTKNGVSNYMTGGSLFGWVKKTSTLTRSLFSLSRYNAPSGEVLGSAYISGSGFQGFIRNASGTVYQVLESTPSTITGVFYFFTVTCDGTSVKLYINNVLSGSTAIVVATEQTNSIGFAIGNPLSGQGPDGQCDEFGYVNKALTVSEINYLWNSGNGIGYSKLISDAA